MSKGMFLGRFQPFHKGHLAAVVKMLEECGSAYVVIGSANMPPNPDNPYTAFERRAILEIALRDVGLLDKCEIFVIEDIPDDNKWVAYVEEHVPVFSHVYAGEGLHFDLFKESGKYQMVKLGREKGIEATSVRDAVISGGDWKNLVPEGVAEEMEKMGLWRITASGSQK